MNILYNKKRKRTPKETAGFVSAAGGQPGRPGMRHTWTPKVCKIMARSHYKWTKRLFIYILLGCRYGLTQVLSWAFTVRIGLQAELGGSSDTESMPRASALTQQETYRQPMLSSSGFASLHRKKVEGRNLRSVANVSVSLLRGIVDHGGAFLQGDGALRTQLPITFMKLVFEIPEHCHKGSVSLAA